MWKEGKRFDPPLESCCLWLFKDEVKRAEGREKAEVLCRPVQVLYSGSLALGVAKLLARVAMLVSGVAM